MRESGCRVALVCMLIGIAASHAWAQPSRVAFEATMAGGLKPQWSANRATISTTPVGDRKYLGPFGGESVLLNLTDLAEHQLVKVSLDVLIIRGWDGNSAVEGPDIFYVYCDDGRLIHATSFSLIGPQSFPGFFSVHSTPAGSGTTARNKFGFTHEGLPRDGIFRLQFFLPHRGPKLGLRLVSTTQSAIADEAWGIAGAKVELVDPQPKSLPELTQSWERLGANPELAAAAVWELAASGPASAEFLTGMLAGASVPMGVELLDPTRAQIRPKGTNAADGFAITNVDARRTVLAAHILQLIGTDAAKAARQAIAVKPLTNTKTVRITVRDSSTRQPIPYAPIWAYVYSAALHASALTDQQGVATFDLPSQGLTNILFQNARSEYVPVGIRTTLASMPATFEMPLERTVPVGGVVLDDERKPIPNTTVQIIMTHRIAAPMIARLGSMSAITDAQGRWSMDLGPAAPDAVQIGIRSPLAAPTEAVQTIGYLDKLAELQKQELAIIVARPTVVQGTVVDADTGAPIQRMQVRVARVAAHTQVTAWQPIQAPIINGAFEIPIPQNVEGIIVRIDADGYLTTTSELIPAGGGLKKLEMKLFSPR